MNIALCFCVRNCEPYLNRIFKNIDDMRKLNFNIFCIFIYDNCSDNSGLLLKEYEKTNNNIIIKEIENTSPYRTVRIATARNTCLNIVYNYITSIDYHIMIDCDDVCCNPWNLSVLNNVLNNVDNDDWDCISFNRTEYYDMWALMFDNFRHHCWGFYMDYEAVINIMKNEINNKLLKSKTNSIEVMSAFNGFCIYKTNKFKGIHYKGLYYNINLLISNEELKQTVNYFKSKYKLNVKLDLNPNNECCEHLYYNLCAHKKGCKIKISKFIVV
jgi:hypothetical protein